MKQRQNSLIVGAQVVLDYPNMWKFTKPEFQAGLHEDVKKNKPDYGVTGTIVTFNPDDEKIGILRPDGTIWPAYLSWVTITQPAPQPEGEILSMLVDIREILSLIHRNI